MLEHQHLLAISFRRLLGEEGYLTFRNIPLMICAGSCEAVSITLKTGYSCLLRSTKSNPMRVRLVRVGGISSREPPISICDIRSLQEELAWSSGSNNMSETDTSLSTLLFYMYHEHTSRIRGCVTDNVG